jgi:glycerophosphoryl diester phosphodiesterase
MFKLPRVIGHRGAAGYAPENTLAGFVHAAQQGVGWVEFDVRLTKDGVPVLLHDDDLDRTTNGVGRVAAATLKDIKKLDAGSWFDKRFAGEPVPTLAEALDVIHGCGMTPNIEIKANAREHWRTGRVVGEELERSWPPGRPLPLVSSFKMRSLAGFKQVRPDLPVGFNVWRRPHYQWALGASFLKCVSVHFPADRVTASQIAAAKAAGRRVVCYTVNDASLAERLFARGVDAVFTDVPDKILAVVADL